MQITQKKLKNGLNLIHAQKELPTNSIFFFSDTGSYTDPDDKHGLAYLTNELRTKRTRKYKTAVNVNYQIESVGGELFSKTGRRLSYVGIKVLPQHSQKALELLKEIILQPQFSQKDLEKDKKLTVEQNKARQQNPAGFCIDIFLDTIYSQSGLGHHPCGKIGNLYQKISHNDLYKFQDEFITKNSVIVTVGNIDDKELRNSPFSEKIPAKPQHPINKPSPKPFVNTGTELDQAVFCYGYLLPKIRKDNYFRLKVADAVLGNSNFNGLTMRIIREKEAIAYYAYSYLQILRETGVWMIYAGVTKRKLKKAIKISKDIVNKVINKDITNEQLRIAKQYLIGKELMNKESSDDLCLYYGTEFALGMPLTTPVKIIEEINRVTLDDIASITREIAKNKPTLVVNGDKNYAL